MMKIPDLPIVTRLLVVDDDLVQRRVISKLAAQAGHDVIEAGTVAAAQDILAEQPIDCVTVDIGLTDGVGADVLHAIAENRPRAQVLVVTGESGRILTETLRIARENEIDVHDVFLKPLDLVALRASLWRAREILWARRDAA
jgi:DNA-binding NtrC family response regulator